MTTLPGTSTARDVNLLVTSPLIRAEKRLTPSWTVSQLKSKLETVTGIPPGSMGLSLKVAGSAEVLIAGENSQIGRWISELTPGSAELVVCTSILSFEPHI